MAGMAFGTVRDALSEGTAKKHHQQELQPKKPRKTYIEKQLTQQKEKQCI